MKRKFFSFELKSLDSKGQFSGYGSVFDVLDLKGDVVKPGAFGKSLAKWATKDRLPPILWQHDSRSPIGPYTKMAEDGKGLYTEGQLLIKDVQQAREAYALLDAGAINGQSIGYDTVDEDYDAKAGVWNLNEIDLWECSIVTFPANTDALVENVKSALERGNMPSLRDFEDFLRESGFSKSVATAITSRGYAPILRSESAKPSGSAGVNPDVLGGIVDLIATKSFQL